MNIHEYQAKEIFRRFGLPVPAGMVATGADEAVDGAVACGLPAMVKAQVLTGGRGKAGGIVADSCQAALQPENQGRGFDFVKFAEACGTLGERITYPGELKAAFQRGIESGVPYIIDVIIERETDCSMGLSINSIREFE